MTPVHVFLFLALIFDFVICVSIVTKSLKSFTNQNKQKSQLTKSVYVAGAWFKRDELKQKMRRLTKMGFEVTSKWPTFEDKLSNPDDYAECSKADIDGVVTADTILAFLTETNYPYRGTFTEIGCAIGSGKRIIVICNGKCKQNENVDSKFDLTFSHDCMSNVFFWDSRIEHVATFDDALKLMTGQKVKSPFEQYYSGSVSESLANKLKKEID